MLTSALDHKMEPPECWASSVPSPEYFRNHNCNIGRVKSFVDDLRKERGIVSMRVVFALRSAEIKPSLPRFVHHFFDFLWKQEKKDPQIFSPCGGILRHGGSGVVVVFCWACVFGVVRVSLCLWRGVLQHGGKEDICQ